MREGGCHDPTLAAADSSEPAPIHPRGSTGENEEAGVRTALDAVNSWQERVGTRLERVLAPIYGEGPRHPLLIGSGVLIRLDEMIFLLSAGHVADQIGNGPHYFGAAGRLLPLPHFREVSPLADHARREDDRIDLAHWVLDPATAGVIPSADTLFPQDLDMMAVEDRDESAQFLIEGYPFSRQPRHFDGREWGAKPFTFLTEELTAAEYVAADVDRSQNLFLDYEKHATFRDGKGVTGPDLQGVSGGAVWRLGGRGASPNQPLLTGTVISWRAQSEPYRIIATRLGVWLRQIARGFPHVRAAPRRGIERQPRSG